MYKHIFSLEPHFINIIVPNKSESNKPCTYVP